MAGSWTYENTEPTTDGSGVITKRLIVEPFASGAVSVLATSDNGRGALVLLHLDPDDAEALACALRSAAKRSREAEPDRG